MRCDKAGQVHAYHDGELSPADRFAIESHLRDCSECRDLLEDLRRLSVLLGESALAAMPPGLDDRMHGTWYSARDREVRRLAGWLTAAAAAALVVTTVAGWPGDRSESAYRVGAWELAAVMPPAPLNDDAETEKTIELAQWLAADLSSGFGEDAR